MERSKISMFFHSKGDLFPLEKHEDIGEKLAIASDDKWRKVWNAHYKNPRLALFLTILPEIFGVASLYLENKNKAIGKILLTLAFALSMVWSATMSQEMHDALRFSYFNLQIVINIALFAALAIWQLIDILRVSSTVKSYNYYLFYERIEK